ncbi:hypothetical protein BU24DRAFT_422795 [Aaosphaeria arxii CBS 175.79]|uniref:Uncharacterized protein n=1 Tax=Aaosphaeria arxii CBS 175.79 TaxID=1450172 RepID=A0A6A5XU24_9PLEO|nr:uncharacterized protein BU24DRAFT_422795 [Aaosphaeria arxii CBS 175.79]KAF2016453.1 hypothetical protein BU24DRAFT_422795 [Aaosphaeria arxii CBS 175.79]
MHSQLMPIHRTPRSSCSSPIRHLSSSTAVVMPLGYSYSTDPQSVHTRVTVLPDDAPSSIPLKSSAPARTMIPSTPQSSHSSSASSSPSSIIHHPPSLPVEVG